jgi:hypothetical protein
MQCHFFLPKRNIRFYIYKRAHICKYTLIVPINIHVRNRVNRS